MVLLGENQKRPPTWQCLTVSFSTTETNSTSASLLVIVCRMEPDRGSQKHVPNLREILLCRCLNSPASTTYSTKSILLFASFGILSKSKSSFRRISVPSSTPSSSLSNNCNCSGVSDSSPGVSNRKILPLCRLCRVKNVVVESAAFLAPHITEHEVSFLCDTGSTGVDKGAFTTSLPADHHHIHFSFVLPKFFPSSRDIVPHGAVCSGKARQKGGFFFSFSFLSSWECNDASAAGHSAFAGYWYRSYSLSYIAKSPHCLHEVPLNSPPIPRTAVSLAHFKVSSLSFIVAISS